MCNNLYLFLLPAPELQKLVRDLFKYYKVSENYCKQISQSLTNSIIFILYDLKLFYDTLQNHSNQNHELL